MSHTFTTVTRAKGPPPQPVVPRSRVYGTEITRETLEAAKAEAWEAGYRAGEAAALKSLDYMPEPTPKSMLSVLGEVAEKYELHPDVILGTARLAHAVRARQEVMYRLHYETGRGSVQIGRFLGGRDHSTVLHGIRRHKARIDAGDA